MILQPKAYSLLSAILEKGNIPHALLFSGIEGVGKQEGAMMFAMACNCAEGHIPCGCCKSCNKIQSGNHPDIHLVEPRGAFTRIDQIRSLCGALAMKPYEAKVRVAILSGAHTMNPEASNALLKVLEEPPGRTVLILTAIQLSDLLPTIVSRCQHIRFSPVPQKKLEAFLIEKGVDSKEAVIISALANGSLAKIGLSPNMPGIRNWINRRNWLINELEAMTDTGYVSSARVLAFAEKLSKNKETLQDSLEIMKLWLRDLIICKYDPDKIMNRDIGDRIHIISGKIGVKLLLSKIKAIQTAQKYLVSNANLRLTLDVLMIRLAR
ncbi:MAG: DNA polymerase III subunit delta' [Desulfobacteraceae bacterium]|nr:DNA polymerase III subunit delta' [Desulfobacteraceae bacterium]